ncbi:MAG: ABC transporter permease subunit [Myxococcota bacterium]|nr:ABC transporter permease subunit [Myxococcota bacterium]
MSTVLAIARNTFKEAIRDRILYGFLFFATCLILFSLVLGQLSFGEEVRAIIDVGLAGISFFAVLMAIFLGIALLRKEIEKRTLYTVLSRPISRSTYLLGKFFGLVSTLIVQIALMVAVWIAVLWIQGSAPQGGIGMAMVLIICEAILVTAMSLFFTSFSSPFLSGLFCMGIFVAGRNADLIGQLAEKESLAWLAPFLDGIATALPNFYLFFPSGKMVAGAWATVHGQFVTSGYLFYAVGYSAIYTAFFLVLSVMLMNRRDFI